tara:strand:- start:463 stop:801 length:339 start_codon:yes stop_codon:yes gene_type:complete
MIKHKGFPSRMSGTDFQFTVRHMKKKVPSIIKRKRKPDALPIHVKVDTIFLKCLIDYFGVKPFVRGNLDTARLSWLFGNEIIPADDDFSPVDYDAKLKINYDVVKLNYPELI